jgi:hypothetical protein
MNTASERQATSVRVLLPIDETTLEYIRYRCYGEVKKVLMKSRTKIRSFTANGMKRYTKRAKRKLYLLRFETENQLNALRKIIGDTCTIGIRRRRPKVNTMDKLTLNNTINLLHAKENLDSNELTCSQHISHNSIDFLTDQYETYMVVRYHRYTFNDRGVTNAHSNVTDSNYVVSIMSSLNDMHVSGESTHNNVRLGQIFSREEDVVMEVTFVNDEYAVLTCIEPDDRVGDEVIERDLELLYNQICAYNNT